jgi:hypothetical protein
MNSRLLSQLFLLLSVLSFLSVTSISPAQTPTPNFTLTTIQESGPRANSYNIVFLPDGYTKDELPKFQSDTQKCVNTFFNQPVFKEYQTYFNIYRIDVPSNQSGSDHPELNTTRDTYFNSTYNFNNRPRMIYTDAVGATRIYDTAAQYVPEYDQIIVIVNDSTYGGTGGGGLSFICNGPDAPEILMHELGHAIGQLSDEYSSNEGTAPRNAANCTQANTKTTIPWTNWISPSTPIPTAANNPANPVVPIGLYANTGDFSGWYRPTADSRMRSLYRPYGAVNEEALILKIYEATPICSGFSPSYQNIAGSLKTQKTFSIKNPKSPAHPLKITWTLDGVTLPNLNTATVDLWSHQIGNGTHTLTATIRDDGTSLDGTTFIVSDPNQVTQKSQTWNLTFWNQVPYVAPIENIILPVNTSLTKTITSKNNPTFRASGLPPGLQIDPTTGTISGITQTPGTYPITLSATNQISTETTTFTVTVPPPPQFLPQETDLAATVASPFAKSLPTDQTVTLAASGIPPGMSLNPSTQTISGTPTVAGSFSTIVTASNTNGSTALTLHFLITNPPLTLTTSNPPTPLIPQPYAFQFASSNRATYSASNLPPGLTLNTSTGLLSGIPTTPGTYLLTLTLTDLYQQTLTKDYTLTVPTPPYLTIPQSLQTPLGQPYSNQLSSTQTATFSGANLPPGVTLTNTGLLTGTPTAVGTYRPLITTSNSNGSSSTQITISILPPRLTISPPDLSSSRVGRPTRAQITTSNPSTFTAVGLPPGLALNARTGELSGTPTQSGTYTVTLSARDLFDQTAAATLPTFTVPLPPQIPNLPTTQSGTTGLPIAPIPLTPPAGARLQVSALPPGLTFTPQTATIEGTPTTAGTYPLTLTASNDDGQTTATLTITINPPPDINPTETLTYQAILPHPHNSIATIRLLKTGTFSGRMILQGSASALSGRLERDGTYKGTSADQKFAVELRYQITNKIPSIALQIKNPSTNVTTQSTALPPLTPDQMPEALPGRYTFSVLTKTEPKQLSSFGIAIIAKTGMTAILSTATSGASTPLLTRVRADLTIPFAIASTQQTFTSLIQNNTLAEPTQTEVSVTDAQTGVLHPDTDNLVWTKLQPNQPLIQTPTKGTLVPLQPLDQSPNLSMPSPIEFQMAPQTSQIPIFQTDLSTQNKIALYIRTSSGTFTGRITETNQRTNIIQGIYQPQTQQAFGFIRLPNKTSLPIQITFTQN